MSARSYLYNNLSTLVPENLEGLVRRSPHLCLIRNSNIVIRRNFTDSLSGKVALISGGGSGHEPSHAGFIGRGLLAATISGAIFSAPPAAEIVRCLRLIHRKSHAKSALLIVPNYTGDRLNFGLACEQLKSENFRVELFFVADDVCSTGGRIGRRGLAGVFFIHKIAGFLAENGVEIDKILSRLNAISSKFGTISVTLSSCSIPGVGFSFDIECGKFELGLGIHGERGIERTEIRQSRKIVEIMIDKLVDSLKIDQHSDIALLINNLGSLTVIELNQIVKDVIDEITSRSIRIERIYVDTMVTSLNMAGFSVSMLIIDEETLEALDSDCESTVFTINSPLRFRLNDDFYIDYCENLMSERNSEKSVKIDAKIFVQCVKAACNVLINGEHLLNRLDSGNGDSDCGSTLAAGARAILTAYGNGESGGCFTWIVEKIQTKIGGSSGALYCLMLTGVDSVLEKEIGDNIDLSDLSWQEIFRIWRRVFDSSIEILQLYGAAEIGDRTMLDVLHPVREKFREIENNNDISDILLNLNGLIATANSAANKTGKMRPKIGRHAYFDNEGDDKPDPGAYAVSLWLNAVIQVLIDRFACD